ncbi:hypothetical protein Tco_1554644 [Tanacetum coccineum]
MYVIEQPLPAASAANSEAQVLLEWNAVYDAYNEIACLILGSMTPELHRQFENSSPYDMIKELKAMFEKQAGMKGYVDQLERLGYVLPQDLIVGLILNGLTRDFSGSVRNYNMHNMGKTVGELHVMLIEYEKGLPKKAETPHVMMIKGATKGLLDKAKGNVLGMEIVRDQSGNTLRVSQSRGLCCGKNGKWSCIYAVGSQEYQVVWTRPDIASVGVNMSDGFDRGLQTNVQVFMDFDYAMSRSITVYGLMILGCSGSLKANLQHIEALSITEAGYMTFTEAWKKEIWPKGPILAVSRIGVSI